MTRALDTTFRGWRIDTKHKGRVGHAGPSANGHNSPVPFTLYDGAADGVSTLQQLPLRRLSPTQQAANSEGTVTHKHTSNTSTC